VAALAEKPQVGDTIFNRGTPQEVTIAGRAIVARYQADGTFQWAVSLSAAENLFPGSIAFRSDGGVVAAGTFKHGGSTEPYELYVGDGSAMQTFTFPRPADDLYLPFVVAFDATGKLEWAKADGSGILLVDANRIIAVGPTLTIYDYAGTVVQQRTLLKGPYAYQTTIDSAGWLPNGGFIGAGHIVADATLEPGTPNEKPLVLQGQGDAFVARYAADGGFKSFTMFPDTPTNTREVVDIGPQSDGSAFFVSRTRDSSNKLHSYLEHLNALDQVVWTRAFDTASEIWSAGSGDGVAYVGGIVTSNGEYPIDGNNKITLGTNDPNMGGFFAQYSSDGTAVSIVTLPNVTVLDLTPTGSSFLVAGAFANTTTFGGVTEYTSLGSTDLFVGRMKLAP
jgi:hypothetical protein